MTLSSLGEVGRWVLSWGGKAVVVAPAELCRIVRAAAEDILKSSV
jgi:predicted DNA-binding transcriptional regulator YafY